MSKRKDTGKPSSAAAADAAPPAPETPAAASEQSSLAEAPAETPKLIEVPEPIPTPRPIEMPRPVEMAFKAIEAMKPAAAATPAPEAIVAPVEAPAVASVPEHVAAASNPSRSHRFALLAASVAFAGAVGAMVGTLSAVGISRPAPAPAQTPLAALDLTSMQDSIAGLRTELSSIATMRAELSSIKSGLDSSSRNSNAQFAKFTERLDRIDRAQAAPSAQLKQAMDAIERLERRVQTMGQAAETTGSVRPQTAAATPAAAPAAAPAAEVPVSNVIDGWVVRHVNRGVAVIQGRRMGMIEVETGDVVPGVGRIESIRRQDGRWVVVTSKGMITSPQPR